MKMKTNKKKLKKKKAKQRPSVKITKGFLELMNLAEPLMTKEQTTLGEATMKNLATPGIAEKRDSSENNEPNGQQPSIDTTEPHISMDPKPGTVHIFS